MHTILMREELSNIICWMPHGRSWKIVNPKEFEVSAKVRFVLFLPVLHIISHALYFHVFNPLLLHSFRFFPFTSMISKQIPFTAKPTGGVLDVSYSSSDS